MQSILNIFGSVGVFDAVLIFFIAGFTVYGFFKGIIRMAGELVGYLVGIYIAGHYFELFYEWTQSLYLGYENIGRLISFLLLLFIVRKLVTLGVYLIDRFFDIISIIPFFGLINRFAGALFGFLSITIVLGVAIYFASRYSIGFSVDKFLVSSAIAKFLLHFGEFVSPLLPGILRNLHSLL
jgi:uncharacterized membrane protein required for colicin V production